MSYLKIAAFAYTGWWLLNRKKTTMDPDILRKKVQEIDDVVWPDQTVYVEANKIHLLLSNGHRELTLPDFAALVSEIENNYPLQSQFLQIIHFNASPSLEVDIAKVFQRSSVIPYTMKVDIAFADYFRLKS